MDTNIEGSTMSIANNWKNRHLIKKCRKIDELRLDIQIAELENRLEEIKDKSEPKSPSY